MRAIGTRWPVPKKEDKPGWRELRDMVRRHDIRAASLYASRFADHGNSVIEEMLPSEYRAEYRLRHIIRRPGA